MSAIPTLVWSCQPRSSFSALSVSSCASSTMIRPFLPRTRALIWRESCCGLPLTSPRPIASATSIAMVATPAVEGAIVASQTFGSFSAKRSATRVLPMPGVVTISTISPDCAQRSKCVRRSEVGVLNHSGSIGTSAAIAACDASRS